MRRTVVAAALLVGAGAAASGATATVAAPTVGTESRSCAWEARMDPTLVNTLYPDAAAQYWFSVLPATPGASLVVQGRYPHARYMSFATYDPALRAVDGLHDAQIAPDPGSTNVFVAGAPRNLPDRLRHYTVHAVFGQRPASPAPNTVYTTSTDGSHAAPYFLLVYRVYRPDRGLDIAGGEPLPSVTYVAPGGAEAVLPVCRFVAAPDTGANRDVADAGRPSQPLFGYPGTDPPTWHRFYNAPTSVAYGATDNGATGTAVGDAVSPWTMRLPAGGFLENPDNKYVFAQLSRGYDAVAVIHARLPTTVHTYDGEARMGTGQLRYWSMCSNDGPSERYYGCVDDDQVALDAQGYFTIVVSQAASRPANARPACGVEWLPGGPTSATLMIMRNMLPDPSFTQAIQDAGYGTEARDLGAYYPATTYTSAAAFAARGCTPPAVPAEAP